MSARDDAPDAPEPVEPVDPVELANSLESLDDDALRKLLEESRIVIRPGGEVIIENLTAGLLDVAYTLDPENPGIQCRVEATGTDDDSEDAGAAPEETP